jgi:hypothetical protein
MAFLVFGALLVAGGLLLGRGGRSVGPGASGAAGEGRLA